MHEPSQELARAIRTGPFELAIKLALRDSGLSLDRIEHRLACQGPRVSASSLSNWQTGRSRPERTESIHALRGLERLLGLPAGSMLQLLGPRRPRGRWIRHVPGSVRYDALFEDHDRLAAILAEVNDSDDHRRHSLSVDERVTLDADRRFRLVQVRQLVTALVDGVDSCVVFFHAEDGPVPEIAAPEGCRLGRTRTDADITVAELLLDHRLDRDDVFLLEYEFRFPRGRAAGRLLLPGVPRTVPAVSAPGPLRPLGHAGALPRVPSRPRRQRGHLRAAVALPTRPHRPPVRRRQSGRDRRHALGMELTVMVRVVLRVRLTSGDQLDVTYDEADLEDEHEIIEHVISTLSNEFGALRVRHNDRLTVLFARGVAAIEIAPLGPVL